MFLMVGMFGYGQTTRVLFIGNSYTGVNNLPQMTYDVALSTNDTLIIDSHTPGGQRLMNHASSTQALAKINSQQWDYVVLQAQSQEPSWPISQVETEVYPYAKQLCDLIRANNTCSMPVFYMTWGRKNGDASNCASWPPVCTYVGMDSLLNERYQAMGKDNDAFVSPVGAVWHYIRENYPQIELYNADESHPSVAGSYAAACTFYSVFLRKDPTFITVTAGLSSIEAKNIRASVKYIVYDDLVKWNIGEYDPVADFSYTQSGSSFDFSNLSVNATSYWWGFGDGDTSIVENPHHNFIGLVGETFSVKLKAEKCGLLSEKNDTVTVVLGVEELSESKVNLYPNPSCNSIVVEIESPNPNHDVQIRVFDLNGKLVFKKMVQNNQVVFSVSNFPVGMYTYIIGDNSGSFIVE